MPSLALTPPPCASTINSTTPSASSTPTTVSPTYTAAASTSATASPVPTTAAHNPGIPTNINLPLPPSTLAVWTRSAPVLLTSAPSPHTSAWSVTCESIAQRLANQCLEHQPTLAASASTDRTASAHSATT
nr:unnamed protein product [Spirometra erinaceieuropaei]